MDLSLLLFLSSGLFLGWSLGANDAANVFGTAVGTRMVRFPLVFAGAFGAYSLGANNIANVMGVFVEVSPFTDLQIGRLLALGSVQQLFLLGAVAIAVGAVTYSKRVMLTVGAGILPMSPVAAWVVVMSHSIVLFLFASEGLEHVLADAGLPTIPLVPVSSSQAVVGAVIGLGLMRGGGDIDWRVLRKIGIGWVMTPLIAAAVCFVALFFVQNVFDQQVYRQERLSTSLEVLSPLSARDVVIAESLTRPCSR